LKQRLPIRRVHTFVFIRTYDVLWFGCALLQGAGGLSEKTLDDATPSPAGKYRCLFFTVSHCTLDAQKNEKKARKAIN
jgi:hypothetical protein